MAATGTSFITAVMIVSLSFLAARVATETREDALLDSLRTIRDSMDALVKSVEDAGVPRAPAKPRADERQRPFMMIGMASVSRPGNAAKRYLHQTLAAVLGANLDRHPVVRRARFEVVVVLADEAPADRASARRSLETTFGEAIRAGRLHLMPLESGRDWYPAPLLSDGALRCALHRSGKEALDRAAWRSKQVMDVAYALATAGELAVANGFRYYLHLEDDTPPRNDNWYVQLHRSLERVGGENGTAPRFGLLHSRANMPGGGGLRPFNNHQFGGAFGLVMHAADAVDAAEYLRRNYDTEPVDWLLGSFFQKERAGVQSMSLLPGIFLHRGDESTKSGRVANWDAVHKRPPAAPAPGACSTWERCAALPDSQRRRLKRYRFHRGLSGVSDSLVRARCEA